MQNSRPKLNLTAGVALLAAIVLSGLAAAQPLQPADIFRLEAAADPRISPDGTRIAYIRRSNDIRNDETLEAVWLVEVDGTAHRPLLTEPGTASLPRWSPDGARLAYLHQLDSTTTLRVFEPATGAHRSITTLEIGPGEMAWSPDGSRLAVAAFLPGQGVPAAALPQREDDMDWAAGAQVVQRLGYRFDGVGPMPVGSQQLFLIDLATGRIGQLTRDSVGASGDFAWTADGRALVFAADRRPASGTLAPDSELFRLDIATGRTTPLTGRTGPDTSPRPSPDGRHLAWLGFDDQRLGYHNVELYVGSADGSSPRSLSHALDRSVAAPVWRADGQGLLVLVEDHGDTRIAEVSLDGTTRYLTDGLIGATFGRPYTGGSFSLSDTGLVAATLGSSTSPSDIYVGEPGRPLSRLTSLNADILPQRRLSPAEPVSWTSPHDGRQIDGWVLYPPGFDTRREWPMILEIHGGPFSAYGPSFSAELQLMAAAGYVVLFSNPRGSTSYGHEFANLIHHDYPGDDYDDLMGGVDFMLSRGFVDPDRLFVTGGSGGGVLTAWIIGKTDRFAAAAVVKPVINWASFVLYSDLPQYFYRYWFAGPPWEIPDEYWRRSPLSLVGEVSTPTLLMVGGSDLRTPVAETEQYYAALQLRGVPSRLVTIPETYHGIANSRPSRLLTKVAEILRWFEEYDPAPNATGTARPAAE
ncbi:prolyl oligopeptidase family serine peptidase [Maricaulis sp. CAU 1757]